MKKKSSIRLGPGAPSLILIFVILSMAVLAVLSLMSARNDLQLSRRSAEAAETIYRLRETAEERRAAVGQYISEGGMEALESALMSDKELSGMRLEENELIWTETDGTRTLHCAVRADETAAWTGQWLTTSIGEDTAQELENEAKLALADAILARQAALDDMLERCAEGTDSWDEYMTRIADALRKEPAGEGVSLVDGVMTWVETDGTYSYACSVVIHPLDAEQRSDFDGIPVLLEEDEEV